MGDRAVVGLCFSLLYGFRFPALWFIYFDLSPVFVACVSFSIYFSAICTFAACQVEMYFLEKVEHLF
jgi:hypothetical protein